MGWKRPSSIKPVEMHFRFRCYRPPFFEEFDTRVDDLLTQVAGPAAGREMFKRAKSEGVFNDYHDDASRWTEEQARDVAGHIIRQSQQDAEFVKTALARLAIP